MFFVLCNHDQFLPGHEQWSETVRKRLYYGLDSDSPLDALSCPMTGESTSKTSANGMH